MDYEADGTAFDYMAGVLRVRPSLLLFCCSLFLFIAQYRFLSVF